MVVSGATLSTNLAVFVCNMQSCNMQSCNIIGCEVKTFEWS